MCRRRDPTLHGLRGVHRDVGALQQGGDVGGVLGQRGVARRRCRRAGSGRRGRRAARRRPGPGRRSSPTRPPRRSSGRSTANSSPPSRATVSVSRTTSLSRRATSTSKASPRGCPRVSLTSLKRSMSSRIRPTRVAGAGARGGSTFEPFVEQSSVRQAGERVEQRQSRGLGSLAAQRPARVPDGAEQQQPQQGEPGDDDVAPRSGRSGRAPPRCRRSRARSRRPRRPGHRACREWGRRRRGPCAAPGPLARRRRRRGTPRCRSSPRG